eukprot:9337181-Alexandrium_andersonii.AAC.1
MRDGGLASEALEVEPRRCLLGLSGRQADALASRGSLKAAQSLRAWSSRGGSAGFRSSASIRCLCIASAGEDDMESMLSEAPNGCRKFQKVGAP